MRLLTPAHANAKTAKNKRFKQYQTYILHLAPSNVSGVLNTCPHASKGCRLACLNTAGRGVFNSVQRARIRKTVLLKADIKAFARLLIADLDAVVRKAKRDHKKPVVRLNGTSDLDWTKVLGFNIFQLFPTIQFYDYTKVLSRLPEHISDMPKNYYLTFSRSEVNSKDCLEAIRRGFNVAVVFRSDRPKMYADRPTVDGDSHDLRFKDPHARYIGYGYVVALKAKGRARRDSTGFVVDV